LTSRFEVQGSRFKVQGSRFKVQGSKVQGSKVEEKRFEVLFMFAAINKLEDRGNILNLHKP
jgi:hypothetical protein